MTEKIIDNIYLVAALTAYGGNIEGQDKTDVRSQKFFVSIDGISHIWVVGDADTVEKISSPGIGQIITEFMSNSLMLPPDYPAHLRDVKARIHNR